MPFKYVSNENSQSVRRSVVRKALESQDATIIDMAPIAENSPFRLTVDATPETPLVYMSNEYFPVPDTQYDPNPL